jgi:superfamily II DNA/RNA helicase
MSTPTIDAAVRPEGDIGEAANIVIDVIRDDGASDTAAPPTFAELGVDPRIVAALASIGIERTFAIQELTLPIALPGHDLIGQARTGMGKTLGFGVPLLHRLAAESAESTPGQAALPAGRAPRALIMVPTRELCLQVTRDLTAAAKNLRLAVAAVYGGRAYEPQIAALEAGVDVIVGTPGRLLDLATQGRLVLGKIGVLVLDEADEMLDLGFLPDIERVLGLVPSRRQTMLFSATMPGPIIKLARTFMVQPTHIRAELPADSIIHRTTTQFVYRAHALDKVEMLARILQARGRGLTMVFTRTKRTAAKVAEELAARGFAAAAVHGDLGQGARERSLRAFRHGKVDVLVATDVAARGIDVDGVTHVVNFQCPEDEKTYIHRIGRTGRAGNSGVAVSFVDWDDIPRWQLINSALDLDFADPVETYSSSPHLRTDLDIPADAGGTLPEARRTRAGLDAEKVEDIGETGHRHGSRGSHDSQGGRARGAGRSGARRPRGGKGGSATEPAAAAPRTSHAPEAAASTPEKAPTDRREAGGSPRRRPRRRTRGGAVADAS